MESSSALRRTATGLVSLAALIALAGAVPILLWNLVGWPVPTEVPSLHKVADAFSRSEIPDSTLLKVIAVVGWVAWLQVAASILVETGAWARGHAAPRLRFAGAAQPAVCKLVASAALLISSTHLSNGLVPSLVARPLAESVAAQPAPAPSPVALMTRADRPARETTNTVPIVVTTKVYTVARYDTLWGLARTHLGDPFRWREIFELNRGVRQDDGRALEEPMLIDPGWVLKFPADATGLVNGTAARPSTPPSAASAIARKPSTHAARAAPAACAPATTRHATSPSTIGSPPTTVSKAPSNASSPGTSTRPPEDRSTRGLDPALLIGGSLGAASLVALLHRLRHVQRRRRRPGRRLPAPRPEIEQVERQLRVGGDLDEAMFLDAALRAFAAGAAGTRGAPPEVLAVRVDGGQVELLLEKAPDRPPQGFVATDDTRGWISDPRVTAKELRALGGGTAAPLPALVAIGDIDGGRLLIDLETAGTLTVDGDPQHVEAFIRRIGAELATSIWTDHVDVLAVGATELDIVGTQRTRQFNNFDEALDELAAGAKAVRDALESAHSARTLAARLSEHPDDGWIPTILVCADRLSDDALGRLREVVGEGGRGVGAVVHSGVHTEWHAELGETELVLAPLGFSITPALLDVATARALDELLSDAAVETPDEVLDEQTEHEAITSQLIAEPYRDGPFEVEVRVLGPVEIDGHSAPLERRRCVELAAYLALHPNGVSDERLKTVLWADSAPTTATFNTTVSTTRSRLGRGRDGALHLPHFVSSGGLYRLGARVTTDLARFEARVLHARRCAPGTAIETLRSALDLVRGKPFEGERGYEWAFSEGLIANIEMAIADAAHELAQLYLDTGDPKEATWAAMQGLIAAPGDEILYRDRMLACDRAGNPAGVETVMDELCSVVEALEPYDQLHPETLALYERISHRKRSRVTG